MTAIAATIMAATCIFLACSKEENNESISFNKENKTDHQFKAILKYDNIVNENYLVNPDENLWERRIFDDGKFVSDNIYIMATKPEDVSIKNISDESFVFKYEDGAEIKISEIMSDNGRMSFNVIGDCGNKMTAFFEFPEDINIIEKLRNEGFGDDEDEHKIAEWIAIGIAAVGVMVAEAHLAYNITKDLCDKKIRRATTICESYNCTAIERLCWIDCMSKKDINKPCEKTNN